MPNMTIEKPKCQTVAKSMENVTEIKVDIVKHQAKSMLCLNVSQLHELTSKSSSNTEEISPKKHAHESCQPKTLTL